MFKMPVYMAGSKAQFTAVVLGFKGPCPIANVSAAYPREDASPAEQGVQGLPDFLGILRSDDSEKIDRLFGNPLELLGHKLSDLRDFRVNHWLKAPYHVPVGSPECRRASMQERLQDVLNRLLDPRLPQPSWAKISRVALTRSIRTDETEWPSVQDSENLTTEFMTEWPLWQAAYKT